MKHSRRSLLARSILARSLALGLGIAATAAVQAQAIEPIRIGVLMPTSGGGATYGIPALNGVKLAVDEINAKGGINGRKIEFVVRDTQLKPAVGVAAAKELITNEKVHLLFGTVSSGVALAVSELAREEKIVFYSPIAKTKSLTADNLHKYIFQGSSTSDTEAKSMAAIAGKVGIKKLCATGYDYAYSHDAFAALKRLLPPGVQYGPEFLVKLGTTDYNALISQLSAADCDGVANLIWGGGFISFAKQGKPFGLFKSKKFISGAEIGSHETATSLKADYPENFWSNSYDLWYHSPTPALDAFHKSLAKLEGTEQVNMWPITTYIGIKFIAAAIAKAGGTQADKLVSALEGMSIDTPLGPRTIDAKTHRVNMGQFWGQMLPSKKGDFYEMSAPVFMD